MRASEAGKSLKLQNKSLLNKEETMKRIITWLLIAILTLLPLTAFAEGEGQSEPLRIDTYWKYPGMEKSYAGGYLPTEENGSVHVILPLRGKTQGNTIRVVPELPQDGPFKPTNLQFNVSEKTYNVTWGPENKPGQVSAYLIEFSVPLNSTYYNGSYTIQLNVSYKTPSGESTEQTFSVNVQLTGGKKQSSGGGGGQASVKKPVILIDECAISPEEISAGGKASVKVTMSNVGNYDAKNIRVTLVPESEALTLSGDLNAKFFEALAVRGTLEAEFELNVGPGAVSPVLVTVQISYEDKYGGAYTEEGKYNVSFAQPKIEITDCTYSEIVNGGDTFTATLTVKNTGEYEAKDAVVQFVSEDGSIRQKGAQDYQSIASLKPGETTTITFELRVLPSTLEGKHVFRFNCATKEAAAAGAFEAGPDHTVTVVQKASLGYDEIRLPETVTSGETITVPVCVFNTGFSPIYNIRCTLDCDGLICSSAFMGNLDPQESSDKVITVFVTTLSGSQKYGETYGNIEIAYEDVNGEQFTEYQSVKLTIQEPEKITDEEKARQEQEQKEQQTLSQWWISLLVAIAVIIILIAIIVIARFGRMLRMK